MARILVPLPDTDFDVTEVAVPWKLARCAGHEVVFATEAGKTPAADPLLLRGVLFGKLGAHPEPKRFYEEMAASPELVAPKRWADVDVEEYDGLLLAGGHAPGMRQYLGSEVVHALIARFWRLDRPVGAICHGVLALARAKDPDSGEPVLRNRKTTCLPKYMERSAYLLTFWKLGKYYRTYPAYVEDEVKGALADPERQFVLGPKTRTRRGTADDDSPAFVVEDGRYVSARWPGDAYLFARSFLSRL